MFKFVLMFLYVIFLYLFALFTGMLRPPQILFRIRDWLVPSYKGASAQDSASTSVEEANSDAHSPSTTVLHHIPPSSTDVKTLYDVFSHGREASSEYLYYGEISSSSVKDDNTGDLSSCDVFLEVNVSFERNAIDIAESTLFQYLRSLPKKFSIESELGLTDFSEKIPNDLADMVGTESYMSVLDIEDDFHATFHVSTHPNRILFRYIKFEKERLIEITASATGEGCTVGWLYNRFNSLVEEYKDIPMNKFDGAVSE